ncbi:MAG: hypothetical protein V1659_00755 [Candidatus Woesearchaeota archaeon]
MGEERNGLFLVAIVAIVAVVGIIVLSTGAKVFTTTKAAEPTAVTDVSGETRNLAGEATGQTESAKTTSISWTCGKVDKRTQTEFKEKFGDIAELTSDGKVIINDDYIVLSKNEAELPLPELHDMEQQEFLQVPLVGGGYFWLACYCGNNLDPNQGLPSADLNGDGNVNEDDAEIADFIYDHWAREVDVGGCIPYNYNEEGGLTGYRCADLCDGGCGDTEAGIVR